MMLYQISIDKNAEKRFAIIAKEDGRSIEELIVVAAEEAALRYFHRRKDDPV